MTKKVAMKALCMSANQIRSELWQMIECEERLALERAYDHVCQAYMRTGTHRYVDTQITVLALNDALDAVEASRNSVNRRAKYIGKWAAHEELTQLASYPNK